MKRLRSPLLLLMSVIVLVTAPFVPFTFAKEEFKNEPADFTVVHQGTQEAESFRGIATKEEIACPDWLLERLGFPERGRKPDSPNTLDCFVFRGRGVLLMGTPGVCAAGLENGNQCSTDEEAAACRAGGGACQQIPLVGQCTGGAEHGKQCVLNDEAAACRAGGGECQVSSIAFELLATPTPTPTPTPVHICTEQDCTGITNRCVETCRPRGVHKTVCNVGSATGCGGECECEPNPSPSPSPSPSPR
jgi:hypothetical protein